MGGASRARGLARALVIEVFLHYARVEVPMLLAVALACTRGEAPPDHPVDPGTDLIEPGTTPSSSAPPSPECAHFGPQCTALAESVSFATVEVPAGFESLGDARVADLTADGVPDLVVSASGDSNTSVLVYAGPYHEGDPPVASVAARAEHVGDTDGDGTAELWVTDADDEIVRIDGPLFGTVAVPPAQGWMVPSPVPESASAFNYVMRSWADANGDGLADVAVSTSWDSRVYLAPHVPGEDPWMVVVYPECEWYIGAPMYALLGADSDGDGPDELYVGDRRWDDGYETYCYDGGREGFFVPVGLGGEIDPVLPPPEAVTGSPWGGGVEQPLFDHDGDGVLQWAQTRGDSLLVSAGPEPSFDPDPDPAILASELIGHPAPRLAAVIPGDGADDLLVYRSVGGYAAWQRIRAEDGQGTAGSLPSLAAPGIGGRAAVADVLGLGWPQMIVSGGGPLFIAELP